MFQRLCLSAAAAMCACSSDAEPTTNSAGVPEAGQARPAALSSDPIKRQFGYPDALAGWILACDNVGVCRTQPRSASGAITIRRDPGPDGQVTVLLGGPQPSEESPRPDLRSIRLDGAAVNAPWRIEEEIARLEGEPALTFVRTLARARESLTFEAGYDEPLEIPFNGLPAALRAMDAAQGHEGGEAAFVATGPRPRAQLPSAPELPVVTVAPRASLPPLPAGFAARVRRAARQPVEAGECEAPTRDLDEAHPLNAAEALVILECGHGLTNSSYLLLRVPRAAPARAVPIVLPSVPAADDGYEDVPGLYTNIEWDPEQGSLFSVVRSCMGGCGESIEWVFDGREFRLVGFTFYEAGGVDALDLYRADVRRPR